MLRPSLSEKGETELKIIPGSLADLWVGWRGDKIWFSGCNERWLWRTCACARSLREEVEDRKFCVFERWQITWLCLMIWQHLLTSCINIWAIHHLYRFIALGSTTFLSTHDFFCLVSWIKASYSSFSRGSTQAGCTPCQIMGFMSQNQFCLPRPFEVWDIDSRNWYFAIHHQRFGKRFPLIELFMSS